MDNNIFVEVHKNVISCHKQVFLWFGIKQRHDVSNNYGLIGKKDKYIKSRKSNLNYLCMNRLMTCYLQIDIIQVSFL